jgi:hypothetical protein
MCLNALHFVSCCLCANEIKFIEFLFEKKEVFFSPKMQICMAPEALETLSISWGVFMILLKWWLMMAEIHINPLNTKRRLFYLKTHFVPRSKHFSSRL